MTILAAVLICGAVSGATHEPMWFHPCHVPAICDFHTVLTQVANNVPLAQCINRPPTILVVSCHHQAKFAHLQSIILSLSTKS
jgi:hypothetical protein